MGFNSDMLRLFGSEMIIRRVPDECVFKRPTISPQLDCRANDSGAQLRAARMKTFMSPKATRAARRLQRRVRLRSPASAHPGPGEISPLDRVLLFNSLDESREMFRPSGVKRLYE